MHSYRIYTLSRDEHISRPPRIITCEDDTIAFEEARQLLDGHALEIWDGTRLVGRLEPDHDTP